jgi:hypothetical protein
MKSHRGLPACREVGSGCDALIPAKPPGAAKQARMARVHRELNEGKYVLTINKAGSETTRTSWPRQGRTAGYRPSRKTARRRPP